MDGISVVVGENGNDVIDEMIDDIVVVGDVLVLPLRTLLDDWRYPGQLRTAVCQSSPSYDSIMQTY